MLKYLGYMKSQPDKRIQKMINKIEEQIVEVIEPKYIYKCYDINIVNNEIQIEGCNLSLSGNRIFDYLKDCDKIVLMCATLSINTDRYIRVSQSRDVTKAVIADSFASASIDQVCDNIKEELKQEFNEYKQTPILRPGYGDFSLEFQNQILNVLNADKEIGLSINDQSDLVPQKSITAVIGLAGEKVNQIKCYNMIPNYEYAQQTTAL